MSSRPNAMTRQSRGCVSQARSRLARAPSTKWVGVARIVSTKNRRSRVRIQASGGGQAQPRALPAHRGLLEADPVVRLNPQEAHAEVARRLAPDLDHRLDRCVTGG